MNFVPTQMAKFFMRFALCFMIFATSSFGALAQATVGPSGLPLPRYVSLGSSKINVRHGPGQKYQIAWVFSQSGLPVEIIQEFDAWRKIRDSEGDEGWIHQSLLSGRRTGLIAPWASADALPISLYARADTGAPLRAQLAANVLVTIDECAANWCEITGRFKPDATGDQFSNFKGWVEKELLWGVYPDEQFD